MRLVTEHAKRVRPVMTDSGEVKYVPTVAQRTTDVVVATPGFVLATLKRLVPTRKTKDAPEAT